MNAFKPAFRSAIRPAITSVFGEVYGGGGSIYQKISGTWLFVVDSLTAGAGNIKSPPRFVAEQAAVDGKLGKMWVRAIPASSQVTDTGVSYDGTYMGATTGSMLEYLPLGQGLSVLTGAAATDTITMGPRQFPYKKARIYFIKSPTGGSFNVTQPVVVNNVSTAGPLGEIGYVEITNPTLSLTSIKMNSFTGGDVVIAGWLLDPENTADNVIDLVTFAVAGKRSDHYNATTNIVNWYNELGIDHAYLNIGTNDDDLLAAGALSNWSKMVDDINAAGVSYENMLLVRPNENAIEYNGLWEQVRDTYGIPFANIMRIWGDLAEFQANNWMSSGDITHPNDTWNELFATELYNKRLVSAENALDLGIEPNWLTEFNTNTYIELNTPVSLVGNFTTEHRFLWNGSNSQYLLGSNIDGKNYLIANSDGKLRIRINNVLLESAVGSLQAGWNTIPIKRVGSVVTAYNTNGSVLVTGTMTAADWYIAYIGRSNLGFSLKSKIAWTLLSSPTQEYGWLFNQPMFDTTIPAFKGAIGASWVSRTEEPTRMTRYSHRANGDHINYYSLSVQAEQWGNESWPT